VDGQPVRTLSGSGLAWLTFLCGLLSDKY